jgi:hypothetical protein
MKIKINPDGTFPALTKGEIREAALKEFRAMGFFCWRQNNTSPTRRRTFIGEYGVSDIIGYLVDRGDSVKGLKGGHLPMREQINTNGFPAAFLAVEIKTQGDRLSNEQRTFLINLNKAGGWGFVCEDDCKGGIRYYLYLNEKS